MPFCTHDTPSLFDTGSQGAQALRLYELVHKLVFVLMFGVSKVKTSDEMNWEWTARGGQRLCSFRMWRGPENVKAWLCPLEDCGVGLPPTAQLFQERLLALDSGERR